MEVPLELIRPKTSQIPEYSTDPKFTDRPALELEDYYCLLQKDPFDSSAALKLSELLKQRGHDDEVVRVLENLIDIDSCFTTHFALAEAYFNVGRNTEALRELYHATLVLPEDNGLQFECFKLQGNVFVRLGDYDSAEDAYNRAYRIDPQSDVLEVNLGTLCLQRGQWDEALDRFRRAIALNSKNDKAWIGLALVHRTKGDVELSWGNIEAALEYNPMNETAIGLALDWSVAEGREFRALEFIRQFLVEGGWSERFSLAFSLLAWRRGEVLAATLELERLLAVNPRNEQAMALRTEMKRG